MVTVRKPSIRHRLGIRGRSAVISGIIIALALAVSGVATLTMLHRQNENSTRTVATLRAQEMADEISAGGLPRLDEDDKTPGGGVEITQVIDEAGTVVDGSSETPHTPIAGIDRAVDGTMHYVTGVSVPGKDTTFNVAMRTTRHAGRTYTVLAAASGESLHRGEITVATILLIEFPIILLIAAGVGYLLIGRSLAPVSRITAQAEEITASSLGRRVPVSRPHDEIRSLAITVNAMLDRLESSHDAQVRLVGDASHEPRSPLTTIVGLLDLADDTETPVDIETVRTILLPEVRRMTRMVDDLLLLARADENGLRTHPVDIDLDDLVLAEAARVRALGRARVTIHIEPIRVHADPDLLGRALRNLTDNAVRHAASAVWLTMHETGGWAVITVGDDGPGIPEQQRDRIFDRFARLDQDRRAADGAGLGLAIVRQIVDTHRGQIHVRDGAHGGAAFELRLPIAR